MVAAQQGRRVSHSRRVESWIGKGGMLMCEINRTDVILTEPQGKTVMQKAWAEALESAKKIDPNFSEALI